MQQIRAQFVFGRAEAAVAETMAAFVAVQLRAGRLPSGIPDNVFVLYVKIFSVIVIRYIIIAIPGDA